MIHLVAGTVERSVGENSVQGQEAILYRFDGYPPKKRGQAHRYTGSVWGEPSPDARIIQDRKSVV